MADALLETLSYALRRDGVKVATFEDLVDDGRVRCFDFWSQALYEDVSIKPNAG